VRGVLGAVHGAQGALARGEVASLAGEVREVFAGEAMLINGNEDEADEREEEGERHDLQLHLVAQRLREAGHVLAFVRRCAAVSR
jgi:hypothetical protein